MVSTAGIIIIGDEILSGRTKDTNINWIATELNNIGVRLIEARIISDDSETIIETVKTFTKKFTYVFSCGGIGPTHDDITTESVARAFNQKLVKDPEAMRRLKIHYEGTNIEFNEARQKMAIIPTNSILIDNPVSSAPGYKIENLFVFAGVPKIMQGMFSTILYDLVGGIKLKSKTVSSNVGEGLIAKDLEQIEKKISRQESIKKTNRVLLENNKIKGSISLEGALIDDLSFKNYKENSTSKEEDFKFKMKKSKNND